ncbi:unnamed protein product [Rotaria sordida]|uniref:Uncharacterized protein n=1 Tax=Rotaria sordida TaxID=392033 RepID=A0A815XYQ5_9BILA|nr:unnamed protein product [Rotaria sordida]CAF1564339.1 unnamed protein product [Rotaria sordida]
MSSENDEIIDGWVFSSVGGILSTPLGVALANSLKNKSGIKLWSSLDNNNGSSTFRMQSWSKYQMVNLNFDLQLPSNNILSIKNALMSTELNTIRVSIIDIRPSENFISQGISRTSTFVLIGDQTGTTYLIATDLPSDILQVEKTYDITKVHKKIFNGSFLLSTTIDTHISSSNTTIIPDINDVAETMNINLSEKRTITTSISEVGEIRRSYSCLTCHGDLNEVKNVAALLYCEKCRRHILKVNVTQHISTTLVLKNDQEKIILFVNDQMLHQLLEIIGLNINMIDMDIAIGMMSCGNSILEYSELRKELLGITKPK